MTLEEKENGTAGGGGSGGRGKWVWIALILAVAGVLIAKQAQKKQGPAGGSPAAAPERVQALPRLVDLGATQCIPCKMMAPILEELKASCAGRLEVQFIDVWENDAAGEQYKINMIPTQIFYDAAGKELFRHEGFFSKEDILAKWKEFGVDLAAK